MRWTLLTALFLAATSSANAVHLDRRQFLSTLRSIFDNPDDGDTTTSSRGRPTTSVQTTTSSRRTTTPTQVTVTRTTSKLNPTKTSSTNTDTSTTTDTSTITSSATTTSTDTTTTTPSTTVSKPANASPTNTAPPSQADISPAGIAVAVIFSIVIVLVIAWVIFRYHPKSRAWWLRRQEEKYKQRSYRDALDGPHATLGAGASGLQRTKTKLGSFFAPKASRRGNVPEIKRKTINWGAPTHHVEDGHGLDRGLHTPGRSYSPDPYGGANYNSHSPEKVPLAALGSPMGLEPQHNLHPVSPMLASTLPHSSGTMSPVSPVSGGRRSLGGLSAAASNASRRPQKHDKPLPQVMLNGKEVYELE